MKLRDYQQKVYDGVIAEFSRVQCVLAVVPTGGGKTVIFSTLISNWACGGAFVVAHRREILRQISVSLGRLGVKHQIIAPSRTVRNIRRRHVKLFGMSFLSEHASCYVASVQSLTSKRSMSDSSIKRAVRNTTLVVFDEGHHYIACGQWGRAVDRFEHAKILLVTATPERADGKGLARVGTGGPKTNACGYVDAVVLGPSIKWLIDEGYLSPFRYFCPDSDLDVEGVPLTVEGDFNVKEMRKRVADSNLVGDLAEHKKTFAKGLKTIVFCSDVVTSGEQAEAFDERAVALNGETDEGVRESTLDEFENEDLDILTNCALFDEGFDVPAVACVVHGAASMSFARVAQMNGRGLRPVYASGYDLSTREGRLAAIAAGPKPYAIIIDAVRNWERHGLPDWPRSWDIFSTAKRKRDVSDALVMTICKNCTQPYMPFEPVCPYCGLPQPEPENRKDINAVGGSLQELDVAALRRLFEKVEQENKSGHEYEAELIARKVPPIGRPRMLRARDEVIHRREVLKHLIGWWSGMQPAGRTDSEKQKRFFYRFKIDVATALTLDAPATDKLISDISRGFAHDL